MVLTVLLMTFFFFFFFFFFFNEFTDRNDKFPRRKVCTRTNGVSQVAAPSELKDGGCQEDERKQDLRFFKL